MNIPSQSDLDRIVKRRPVVRTWFMTYVLYCLGSVLKSKSRVNVMFKYADDTNLLTDLAENTLGVIAGRFPYRDILDNIVISLRPVIWLQPYRDIFSTD